MSVSARRRARCGAVRVSVTVAAILAATAALGASAAAAHGRLFHFDITPEPLSQALRTYAQVCGEDVIFTESVVAGANATSLVGDFTADDALSRLLAGTQLVVKRSPSGALMIRRRQQASTDATPSGESQLRVAEAGSLAAADPPRAADPPADPSADPPPPPAAPAAASPRLTEVVVTGSRIASRSYTSDSPLVGVSAAQIAATGQVSLDSALGQMPQFAAAQGQTETGDAQGATGFQGGQSYADLRGLGPERTLVLLDGQRLVPTNPNGSIDLNVLPMALIEGVDVITGGASAVYGSDAVAGVVNFRLRQHFQGIQLSYQHGATTDGYGPEDSVSVLMGGNGRPDGRSGKRRSGRSGVQLLRSGCELPGDRSNPAYGRAHQPVQQATAARRGSVAPDRCGDLRCDGQGVLRGCQGEHRLTACAEEPLSEPRHSAAPALPGTRVPLPRAACCIAVRPRRRAR